MDDVTSASMNLALFDFDGTLTDSDSYSAFVRLAVPRSRKAVVGLLVSPIVLAYHHGLVSATATRSVVSMVGFCGERVSRLEELGRSYAVDVLPKTLREDASDRLEWHRRQGDAVVVVSASLDVYMKPWCADRALHCICTELETRKGRYTGRYVDGDCSGVEKARRVVRRFDPRHFTLVYAYGDTHEDREMLELAHRRYCRGRELETDALSSSVCDVGSKSWRRFPRDQPAEASRKD